VEGKPFTQETSEEKRGRSAKTKSQNLLTRLADFVDSVLAFLHNTDVAFTNNFAEQDIRMIKVLLKILGMLPNRSRC